MIALSAGGCSAATCSELKPLYDVPNIPTLPLDHGCSASHAIVSTWSCHSRSVYSSTAMPCDDPVPRTSARQTARSPSAASRS
jgi:hypothetical protein